MNKLILQRIQSLNNPEAVRFFFTHLAILFTELNLSPENEQVALNVRDDKKKRISVNLNSRLVYSIREGEEEAELVFMVNEEDYQPLCDDYDAWFMTNFLNSGPKAKLIVLPYSKLKNKDLTNLLTAWLKSCNEYVPFQNRSQYRKHHIPELFTLAIDQNLLDKYLSETSPINTDESQVFKSVIHQLQDELTKSDSGLKGFFIPGKSISGSYAWVVDPNEEMNNKTAHFEVYRSGKKVTADIHFEDKDIAQRDKFHQLIPQLPEKTKWISWHNSKSIRFNESFDLYGGDVVLELVTALEYLEAQLGNTVRQILHKPIITNSTVLMDQPLNQILFGPPGTGKTYNTINKALEVLGVDLAGKCRANIKQLYNEKVKEGQIVFTTFHQSMSYEDFIEGIKPETLDGKVVYSVKPGIFKALCTTADTPNEVDFSRAYDGLKVELSEREGQPLELKTPTGKSFAISLNSNDNLTLYTGPNKEKQGVLTKENLQKQINGEPKYVGWEGYFIGVVQYLESKYNYSGRASTSIQNYVLIIDEINRGNVSQIFGELITLIEDDKRAGKPEAIEVELPYSKEKFSVPANLYIIGTMNTADRSVEALDTALRRRFSFVEMPPKPELLAGKGFDTEQILETINKRIEKLLDKDHLIGHSFFINVTSLEGLKHVFQNKINPLLQEYFFGDFGKIGLVIGQGFFENQGNQPDEDTDLFASFNDYDMSDLGAKPVYRLRDVTAMENDEFTAAINTLLKR